MAAPTYQPRAGFQASVAKHDQQIDKIRRQSMTPRQLQLNRYKAYFDCQQYDARSVTWDGRKAMTDIERDTIAHTQVLPPGFWNPGGQFDEVPLSMRRPHAPYQLVRVVVNRFTGLLFSADMHPAVQVTGNPELQSWVEGLIKASHLWIRYALARTNGGSMGSVGLTFRFKNGRPIIEVHDPRWCVPTFEDRTTGEISALEIRYMHEVQRRDLLTGEMRGEWYWYRRIIDKENDTLYQEVPVGDGSEPNWEQVPKQQVAHGIGEFPGVWVRNSQTDDVDGDPDCFGCFDTAEGVDQLLSQAHQGALQNADPTLHVASDELAVSSLKKGSDNAIKTEKGGVVGYAEMNGAGVKSALDVAQTERANFLEVVQCLLDHDKTDGTMTATEIERRESSMHQRGDLFREQYGEHGVKPLVAKMVRASVRLRMGKINAQGMREVSAVKLPPITGQAAGVTAMRELPQDVDVDSFTDDLIELTWPEWVKRGPSDAVAASNAVANARTARVIDQESAVQYIAPYFGISDPAAALERLRQEGGSLDEDLMKALIKAGEAPKNVVAAAGGPPPGTGPVGQSPSKVPASSAPHVEGATSSSHAAAAPPSPNEPTPQPNLDNAVPRGKGAAKPAPGHQEKPWSCGPASLVLACEALGIEVSEANMRELTDADRDGADEHQMIDGAQDLGLIAAPYQTDNIDEAWDEIIDAITAGEPCILATEQWSHWVAAVGVAGDRVIVRDPVNTPENIARNGVWMLTKPELEKLWRRGVDHLYYAIIVSAPGDAGV